MHEELTYKEKLFLSMLFKIGMTIVENSIVQEKETLDYIEKDDLFQLAEKLGIDY